jgi:transposase-like protein
MTNLTDPIFTNEEAARKHFEAIHWPDGPVCPHCGTVNEATLMQGKTHRPGLYQCNSCREPFTVTLGTVMERSHIPLNKWALGFHLMASSKKGMSAHQLHRMLGVTYKAAWFMAHRIREAMRDPSPAPIGGENKVVEIDEMYIGGKEANKHKSKRAHAGRGPVGKAPVVALVERGGETRSFHVANVTAATLRPIIVEHASRKSHIMTDEAAVYPSIGDEFAGHSTVNHSAEEYVKLGGFAHTNTIESQFATFKRGVYGTFHNISEAHLSRYLAEFDFRYNNRVALGINDTERATKAIRGAIGKRLTYI